MLQFADADFGYSYAEHFQRDRPFIDQMIRDADAAMYTKKSGSRGEKT